MKIEDIAELVKIVSTLKEHSDIIEKFKNTGDLNRADAQDKYQKFNIEHPDYFIPNHNIWQKRGQIGIIQTADNATIVSNLIRQRDWLREKSIIKYGKEIIEKAFSPDARHYPE